MIGTDPGAVVHGNFINYYQFNPAEERFRLLPDDVWLPKDTPHDEDEPYLVLDVGCNTGELTQELWKHITANVKGRPVLILGVDLDKVLIERANEKNQQNLISYECFDIMDDVDFILKLREFFSMFDKRDRFDAICCFSVTMWIHLNNGDLGLQDLLNRLSMKTDLLVVEPQPWKCYQKAQRRLRRAGSEFPRFSQLTWRSNVEQQIDHFIQNQLECIKVYKSEPTQWQRSLYFYRPKYIPLHTLWRRARNAELEKYA